MTRNQTQTGSAARQLFASLSHRLVLSLLLAICVFQDLNSSVLVFGLCPNKCRCDRDLRVNCTGASLNLVPITLNPRLEELDLSSNLIKNLGSSNALTVYPHLRRLELARNDITSLVDNAFGSQSRLEILNLEDNRISLLSPNALNGLGSLRILRFNNNSLRSVPAFSQLNSLEFLDLTRNEISHLSETTFNKLGRLRTLSLSQNKLSRLVKPDSPEFEAIRSMAGLPASLALDAPVAVMSVAALVPAALPQLAKLDLSENAFRLIVQRWSPFAQRNGHPSPGHAADQELPPSSEEVLLSDGISSNNFLWVKLEELSLRACAIEFIEPTSFEGLISLLVLKLQDNSLTRIPSEAFKDLPKLEVLQIGGNKMTTIDEGSFSWLRRLRDLDISACPALESIKPGAFRGAINLERLDLSSNPRLRVLGAGAFEGLGSLKQLLLRGNNFTTIDASLVPMGQRLELLDVRGNSIVCDCGAEPLRQILVTLRNRSLSNVWPTSQPLERTTAGFLRMQGASLMPSTMSKGLPQTQLRPAWAMSSAFFSSGTDEPLVMLESSSRSLRTLVFAATEVKCQYPESLRGQLLVSLDQRALGCYNLEWLAIILAIVVVALVLLGAAGAFWFRHHRRKSGIRSRYFSRSSIGTASRTTTATTTQDSMNRKKVMSLQAGHQSPICGDVDNVYWEPYFIVVQPQKVDVNTLAHPPRPSFNGHNGSGYHDIHNLNHHQHQQQQHHTLNHSLNLEQHHRNLSTMERDRTCRRNMSASLPPVPVAPSFQTQLLPPVPQPRWNIPSTNL